MTLNRAWYIFYGLKMGMDRQATLRTIYGEFMDLLACQSIYDGTAKEKKKKKIWSLDQFLALR